MFLAPAYADANPGLGGSSGLITVPSAETLDAGNICIGVWSCSGHNNNFSQKSTLTMPVSMTLGIGTFWEIYNSYPNILFNGDEDASGRGTLDIGTKLRFLGSRSSTFKMAADFLARRHVSENRTIDGVTDLSGKLIASVGNESGGVHLTAGYVMPGSIAGTKLDNGYTIGIGADYLLMTRMKLLGELSMETKRHYVEDNPFASRTTMDASAGIQFYLSPHFTLNALFSTGLGPQMHDNKFIFGISSCQGVGSYVKPIPSVGRKAVARDKNREQPKALKIIPISVLLLKASAPQTSPLSTLEQEVNSGTEELLVKPFGQILISPQQASSNLTSPVIPVDVTVKIHDEEVVLMPKESTDNSVVVFDYVMSNVSGVTPLYGVDVKGVAHPVSKTVPPSISDNAPANMVKLYRKFVFKDGMYELGSSELSEAGKKMLSEVAEQIRSDHKWSFIRVDGHTDNIGSLEYNMDLSLKRAIAATAYLVGNEGIDTTKIFIKGFGKTVPVADNAKAEGRRKNRRTEVQLFISSDEKPK